ncbi:phenylacetic acid degradation protein PaaN [Nitrococcus mobilis]|uniref:Phenylacetic acid degradation protein paaN2 n=1 Tax=Nitrococcus mobilis Nb-231 TaxID=314278 RepID=A4BNX0_9GAMM|nr:phenylacetic acid degradation protein PaaN [Nitrococcus mobilis]EAR22919.1 Phenylacetic acid degradation protein paaN2 [Nitrococcus mobilis Nb-231]
MSQEFFTKHRATLEQAIEITRCRDYWSPYPEVPSGKIYGEAAAAAGQAAFEGRLHQRFVLQQPGSVADVGDEVSPYGFGLGVRYPKTELDQLLPAMQASLPAWRDAGAEARAGVCLEILARLNKRSFEMAQAVMHTTGQGFVMAFQAGATHAQDRGLEAIAYAYEAMSRIPPHSRWIKPQGKHEPLRMDKTFHVVPRGLALLIGVSTFPTWNGYPGLFASLVTGNPVMVKPHPATVLPLALTVEVAQEVLAEAGFDPWLVALVADSREAPVTKELARRPEIRLIDYTGSTAFGNWLEEHCRQAQLYTEKAGVNSVIVDSTDNLQGLVHNLAFSLSLYSGQMCTTPQNIYVPRDGIETEQGWLGADEFAQAIAEGITRLLADGERAAELLGALQSENTARRIAEAARLGEVVLASEPRGHPRFADARVHTPLLLKVGAEPSDRYDREWFGPIAFVVATESTDESIERSRGSALAHGAITWSVYATEAAVLERTQHAALEAGVALSCNLTDGVYVNQSAAFSDFHATGANPAANACLCDAAFVANRFRVVQTRRHAV